MIDRYLHRNVQSDATHKGLKPPFEFTAWLIIAGYKDKYFWSNGTWVLSEIKDPIQTFGLVLINRVTHEGIR